MKKNKIKVIKRKLDEEWALDQAWQNENLVEIESRQKSKKFLAVLILILLSILLSAFGCSTTGQFTKAKSSGTVISPSRIETTTTGTQKLIPNKVSQINKISNGLIVIQQPTVESHDINPRNFEDPPKGATLLNQANRRNISQNFASKNISKNNQPKSDKDIIKPIELVELDERPSSGVKIYWFRLLLFYLISGVFVWIIYSLKRKNNPFNSNENPFAKKPAQDDYIGDGI